MKKLCNKAGNNEQLRGIVDSCVWTYKQGKLCLLSPVCFFFSPSLLSTSRTPRLLSFSTSLPEVATHNRWCESCRTTDYTHHRDKYLHKHSVYISLGSYGFCRNCQFPCVSFDSYYALRKSINRAHNQCVLFTATIETILQKEWTRGQSRQMAYFGDLADFYFLFFFPILCTNGSLNAFCKYML